MAETQHDEPQLDTEVAEDEGAPPPRLDPEVAARREAALALVVQYGDPVLRTSARTVEAFDDDLRAEIARMAALMNDSLGIGLAATQLGRLSRVLVYRVEHDSPVNALVNPVLEWAGSEREVMEEGCLSLPAVHVDVERPVHVRVRAARRPRRGAPDRGLGAGGACHPARDGPPRRRPDPRPHVARPAQGGHARAPRAPDGRTRVRTVYLGTSAFAAAVLERLATTPHRPVLAVTRPDRPAGRGRTLTAPPVADAARALGIEVFQPESVNDDEARARIAAAAPDVVVVCAFGALLKEPLLSDFRLLNVHPSLLPRWRGAAPVERAMMAGDTETGVSIMEVTAGLDSGPVCLAAAEPIRPDDTYGTLAARLVDLGARLLVQALDEDPPCVEQAQEGVTYAEKITAADRTLDPAAPAHERDRVVRALQPHIGARLALDDGSFLGVLRARVGEDGELEPLEVQPPGGRPMAWADYRRGRR